jgi:hypothetical protein
MKAAGILETLVLGFGQHTGLFPFAPWRVEPRSDVRDGVAVSFEEAEERPHGGSPATPARAAESTLIKFGEVPFEVLEFYGLDMREAALGLQEGGELLEIP